MQGSQAAVQLYRESHNPSTARLAKADGRRTSRHGKKPHVEVPFSDKQLAVIAGVVRGLLDKALNKPGASLDGRGLSKGTDKAGPRAGELGPGWEDT